MPTQPPKKSVHELTAPELSAEQNRIIKAYLKLTKKHGRHPSENDLKRAGISESKLRWSFISLTDLQRVVRRLFHDQLEESIHEVVFTRKQFDEINVESRGFKRFVVTTAVAGCDADAGFYAAIKNYCKRRNAKLLLLPIMDPAAKVLSEKGAFITDPALRQESVIDRDMRLNQNLFLSGIKTSAKQVDPLSGLMPIGHGSGSFIFAAPKQFLSLVPTGKRMPQVMMTTGAITRPNYTPDPDRPHAYMSERTAYLAHHAHQLGAIVVEIQDRSTFHFRQVQARQSGAFVDLATVYHPDGSTSEMRPQSFVLGDMHAGKTDPVADGVWKEVIAVTRPSEVVMHDLFNGESISPFDQNAHLTMVRKLRAKIVTLEDEIGAVVGALNDYLKIVDRVVVVKSNHDEWLDRYLEESRYVKDYPNSQFAHGLALDKMMGSDALRCAAEKIGLKNKERVVWLRRDQEHRVAGIELGQHGDKGPNGSFGSIRSLALAFGQAVIGHHHTPGIWRGCWCVGTSSLFDMGYNKGPSSWMHSSCLVYPDGSRQMVNSVYGRWRVE